MLQPRPHLTAPCKQAMVIRSRSAHLETDDHILLVQTSINEDLGASEAQHREIHRLMSFSTRLADLAGSRPSQLQNAGPSDMGIIAEAAGANMHACMA